MPLAVLQGLVLPLIGQALALGNYGKAGRRADGSGEVRGLAGDDRTCGCIRIPGIGGEPGGALGRSVQRQRLLGTGGIGAEHGRARVVLQRTAGEGRVGQDGHVALHGQRPFALVGHAGAGGQHIGVVGQRQVLVAVLHLHGAGAVSLRDDLEHQGIGHVAQDHADLHHAGILQIRHGTAGADLGAGILAAGIQRFDAVIGNDIVVQPVDGLPVHQAVLAFHRHFGNQIGIQGVQRLLLGRDRHAGAGAQIGGRDGHPLLYGSRGPAHEHALVFACRNRARGDGQHHIVIHIGGEGRAGHALRNGEIDHSGRFWREIDLDGAVAGGIHVEHVAALRHGSLTGDDLKAGGEIAGGRRSRDGAAGYGHSAPGVVVDQGRHLKLGVQRPGRLHGLDPVHVAVAGIDVLIGDENRIGGGIGIGVLVAHFLLHVGGGGLDVLARLHLVPEILLIPIVAGEGDGLGIAVDHLRASVAQGRFQAVGGHAQADGHPNVAVGGLRIHMVGNAGAVHIGIAAALHAVVVGAVGAGLGGGVLAGDADAGGQAQIGAVGPRGIIVVAVVVRGAVGVEDHHAAGLDGVGNIVDGGVAGDIGGVDAAGGLGKAHALVGILGGKAAVDAVVGLEHRDVHAAGPAAAIGEGGDHRIGQSLGISAGDRILRKLRLHPGIVAAGDAHGGLPHQEVPVALERARHVGIGTLDRVDDLRNEGDKVRLGHLRGAAHGRGGGILDRLDLGEHAVVQQGVLLRRVDVDGFTAVPVGGSGVCAEGHRGRNAQQHDRRQQDRKEFGQPFSHVSYLPEKLLSQQIDYIMRLHHFTTVFFIFTAKNLHEPSCPRQRRATLPRRRPPHA